MPATQATFRAGALIVHAHVRDDAGKPTSDPARFAVLMAGIRQTCPGMIIQLSTGGRSGAGQARGGMLAPQPQMASLSVGSNNFPTRDYENLPDLVNWLAAEMRTHRVKPAPKLSPEERAPNRDRIACAHQCWPDPMVPDDPSMPEVKRRSCHLRGQTADLRIPELVATKELRENYG